MFRLVSRRLPISESYSTCSSSGQLIWSQLPIAYVMLYGPSAGVLRNVGSTDLKYASTSAGSVVGLSVNSSGAWKPRWESGDEATAPAQSLTLASVKPCPGPVIFQPNSPAESHIFENAIAVSSGVSAGGALYATLSSFVTRITEPYWASLLATDDEIWPGPPNR